MWVTKLLISPVKKRIFCPKTTKFIPKLAFLVNLGQAMQAYSVPCWWLWRAGCISQDTYLLYNIICISSFFFVVKLNRSIYRSSANSAVGRNARSCEGQREADSINFSVNHCASRMIDDPRASIAKNFQLVFALGLV